MALRLFYVSLICLVIFIGCGGGGGGGGGSGLSPVGPSLVVGRISGTIEIDQSIASIRAEKPSILASRPFLDSFVTIEGLTNFSTRADENGKFFFDNVPPGSYRCLARITSLSGREYKIRTAPFYISQTEPEKEAILRFTGPDEAEFQIRFQVKDLDGNPVGKCRIWFWGEQFTQDSQGFYVSPKMPAGASGILTIEPPADKKLTRLEYSLPDTTFTGNSIAIMGFTLTTQGISNVAPVVNISTSRFPNSGSAVLRLFGQAADPEDEPLLTSWQTNVSTFTVKAQNYADWAIPSTAASVTIFFTASEDGRRYPRLSSTAQLAINVASSGIVTFPGEIVLQPVRRATDIFSSATIQLPGNTVARYEARPDFPTGLTLIYTWSADIGTIISGAQSAVMIWKSPALNVGESLTARIALVVSDGIGSATKELQVKVTAAPLVVVERPVETNFEPGNIEFAGRARDYLNAAIGPEFLRWYLATGTSQFALLQTGGATFSYRFTTQGSYTVALECPDSNGITGTGTKNISIINAKPLCIVSLPADNSPFAANTPVSFAGIANDYEDGLITDAAALSWYSSLDGYLGSGTALTVASLTSGMHMISFVAVDSGGAVGSSSITVWYDLPARITFKPFDQAVVFAGNSITFVASGTDADNTPLDSSQFNWYLDGLPAVWQTGTTFSIADGVIPAGTHQIRVEGQARFETVVSPTQAVEVGWPVASVTSPASGTRFEPATPITFVATPSATGTMVLEWFFNDEAVSFGSGPTVTFTPVNGSHKVTYRGTDSQGFVSSSSIGIVVERLPLLNFQPDDSSYIFAGHSITFDATCVDTDNNNIPDSRVSWYLNGTATPWKTGKTFSVTQGLAPAQLPFGTNQVRLQAVGPYGTVGSTTHTLVSGIQTARIDAPTNNLTFSSGTMINFAGVPDTTGAIVMQWWLNYGQPGALYIGAGSVVATDSLPDGYHSITYIGTDSTGFASQNTINVSIGAFPTMDFVPNDGTAFFAGQIIDFSGVGTDTLTNLAIPASRMAWYIDGGFELASYSLFPVTPARVLALGAGLKQVELRGTNSINAVGNVIKNVYLGLQNATITSPITDTVIPPATPFNFTGAPDSTGPVIMNWWVDYGLPGEAWLGAGASLNAIIPDGMHYITYSGTDSGGVVSSATIRVIVSNSPAISFTPSDGSRLFVGQPFTLAIGGAVVPASVKWYRDIDPLTVWKTGSPVVVAPGELAVGNRQIRAEGVNLLGVSNDITNNIYYGEGVATITAPASGTTYPIGALANFAGSPAPVAPIIMNWHLDHNPIPIGVNTAVHSQVIPEGRHTITYLGTDSANFCSSASIQILVNDPPTITFTPPADGVSTAYIFAGRSFVLSGTGVEAIAPNPNINPSTFKWYKDGVFWKNSSPVTIAAGELLTGMYSIDAVGVDQYGTAGTGTHNIYYGHILASIDSPASGSAYPRGSSVAFSGSAANVTMAWRLNGVDTGVTGPTYTSGPLPDGWNTITYLGTDSAGNLSSANTMVLLNDSPTMSFSPGNGSRFFAGSNVTFTGVGTSSITASPILASTMKWYLNGSGVPDKTSSPVTFNSADFNAGANTLKLTGADQFGTVGEVTYGFNYGQPLADITVPASGSSFNIGDLVSLTGSPDTTAPITMYWYEDYALASQTLIGTGANISVSTFTRGIKSITYLGTDSAGLLSSKKINIRVNDSPTMTIATPIAGGKYFGGQLLSVSGSGLNSMGSPIPTAKLSWFLNGSAWKPAVANFSATVAELSTGTQNIRLDGVDELGTSGTVTHTIVTGFDLPVILSPASGTKFNIGDNVAFSGSPGSSAPINFYWYLNYGLPGEEILGTGANISISTFTRGIKSITYLATDSANTLRSRNINITVNDDPTVNINTPVAGGKYFGGQNLNFSASGLNAGGLPVSIFQWYKNSSFYKNGANFAATIAELATGTQQIMVVGTDEFGNTDLSATHTIETGFSLPLITSPASGTRFGIGANIAMVGTPDSDAPIIFNWYLDYGLATQTVFGIGQNANVSTFTRGIRSITYVGTDSANVVRSKNIQLLVNDPPTYNISSLVDGGLYFGGQTLNMTGSGLNAGLGAIPTSAFRWYRNGALWKSSVNNFAATIAELSTGTISISLGGADEFGTAGSATYTFDTGFALPQIATPASGTRVSIGTNVAMTGSPDSTAPITMLWYYNYGSATEQLIGSGDSANHIFAVRGIHTLTYLATDSGNVLRSKMIQVLANNDPVITIATPVNAGKYWGGQSVDFSGSGLNFDAAAIATSTLTWYRGTTLLQSGTASFAATIAQLPTGTHDIGLHGKDEFATGSGATHTIEVGIALPQISSPASGTRFPAGSVSFVGNDLTGKIAMEWRLGSGALLGTGPSISTAALTRGWQTIFYIGTDSANVGRSKSIQVLIDDPPTMTIAQPANNGKYWGGQNVNFSGSGVNSDSPVDPILASTMKWYRGTTLLQSGLDNFAATVAQLPTGTHNIGFFGQDEFGVASGATHTIQVGLSLPVINTPASGTRFDTSSSVNFAGNDLSGLISMEWYWNGNLFGIGPSASIATFTRGWQTVVYIGTDSQNIARSATITVLIDKLPTFTALPFISSPATFSIGPQFGLPGNYIPIHLASAGTAVTFSVAAQNELSVLIPPASITWFEGAANLGTVATLTRNFENPGSYTYQVRIQDDLQQLNNATFTFWIWDTETYHSGTVEAPVAIANSGDTNIYVAYEGVNRRIVRLTRKTTGLTESGDINDIATQTLLASCTHSFVDLTVAGTTVYSLGNTPGSHRIQSWNTTSLHSLTRDYIKLDGPADDQLDNPAGISVDADAIYVSDYGNNKVKKLDINNGNFYSESQFVSGPKGVKYINTSTLYVAENLSNRLLKFGYDLNNVATWNSQTADDASYFANGPSGSLYVTEPSGPAVNVIASSGILLYSFGKFGVSDNQGEFQSPQGIVIVGNDLYVTDILGNKIVRFRSGGW